MPAVICLGCGEPIEPGSAVHVTVQQAKHVITVAAHDEHRRAARSAALEDKTWQRDQSHYAG